MALPNGDLITTVFDPQMAYPVDKRMQVDTLNSRDSISMFIRWEGMTVYVLEDSKIYILQGGRSNEFWKELGTGSGTGGTTFVGQFATADLLPTSGRSAGDYAFVGTGDDFVQYNWDNIANQWVMAEGQTDMASEFFHIGYKTPLRRPVIFPLLPKDVLVETSGDFVFAPETAVARFIFTGEVTAIRGIETAAADREIKLVNRTGSDIPLRDKASGIPSGSGMDFGGSDYTWVNGSEITLKGNGTYWELAPNNQVAFSDHLDSVNAKVSVGSDGLELVSDVFDRITGQNITLKETSVWADGSSMDDDKVSRSYGFYRKIGTKYYADADFLTEKLITAKRMNAKEDGDLSGGGSDDSIAIVNGLRAANELGATFQLSPGRTYKMVGNHVINTNNKGKFTFDLNGATIYQQSSSLRFYNSEAEAPPAFLTTTVTADVFRGKTFVTVSSAAGVQSGDLMMIESPAASGNGTTVNQCYVVSYIDTTTTNKIYVENLIVNDITAQQILDSGTTGNITAKFIRLTTGVRICNGNLISSKGAQYQLLITGQNNLRIDNVEVQNSRRFGIATDYCGNVFIDGSRSYKHGYSTKDDGYVNKPGDPDGESFGYGFIANRVANIRYDNCHGGDGWHTFDVGIGATVVTYNNCHGTKDAFTYSSHGGSWITIYNNCNAFGGYGFAARAAFVYINGGNIRTSIGHAITGGEGQTEFIIDGITVDMSNIPSQAYIYSQHGTTPPGNLSVGFPILRILKNSTLLNSFGISYFEKNDAKTIISNNDFSNCFDLRVSGNVTFVKKNIVAGLNVGGQCPFRVRVTNLQRLIIQGNLYNSGTSYTGPGSAMIFLTGTVPGTSGSYRIKLINNEAHDVTNLVRIDNVTDLKIDLIKGNSYRRGICAGGATNTILVAEENTSELQNPNLPLESPSMPVPLNYFSASGNTDNRPISTTVNGYSKTIPIGFQYFDTSLNKYIWWSGSAWVIPPSIKPNYPTATQNHSINTAVWHNNFMILTSIAGTGTVFPDFFATGDEIEGIVMGGAKTFVGDTGMTIRVPAGGSNVVNQYERFKIKFISPTEAVLSIVKPPSTVSNSSTTQRGIIEQATDAEVKTGTDTERSVDPKSLKDNYLSFTERSIPSTGTVAITPLTYNIKQEKISFTGAGTVTLNGFSDVITDRTLILINKTGNDLTIANGASVTVPFSGAFVIPDNQSARFQVYSNLILKEL